MNSAVAIFNFAKYFFIGFIAAAVWVVPLIDLLYKLKMIANHKKIKGINAIFYKINKERAKIGTPSLGGILIWLTVPVIWLAFFHTPFSRAMALIFFLIGLYGFIDEVFTQFFIKRSEKYRLISETFWYRMGKLAIMYALFLFVAYVAVHFLGVTHVRILGHNWPLTGVMFPVLALFLLASSYATELVDGVDGLSTGLFMLTFLGFVFLNFAFPNSFLIYKMHSLSSMIAVVMGVLAVYLYFNIPPARVFMGSPGAMPMGALFLLMALYTDTVEAWFFFMLLYFLDTATSFLQILSFKLRHKRLFPIAPIHHYFQHIGWPDAKVTMRAWLLQWILVMLGVLVGVWVRVYL